MELELAYDWRHVAVFAGENLSPEFRTLNPFAKVPVLIEDALAEPLFESGAILIYLAETYGPDLLPASGAARWETLKWLMAQVANVGPVFGNHNHFRHDPARAPCAAERFRRTAAELYRTGKVRVLLVTGDNSRTSYDEPSAMRAYLAERGVPEARIVSDYAGFDTYDSVSRAAAVFGERRYVIVSQEFHVRRALYLAASLGHDAEGFAAPGPGWDDGTLVRLREVAARAKAFAEANVWSPGPRFLGPRIVVAKAPVVKAQKQAVNKDKAPAQDKVASVSGR